MENISTSLRKLHMSGMAMCWQTMTETHQADKLTFRDGLEILIQSEMDTRQHNKIARLIKNAGFRQGASLEELETSESRGISAGIISQLATGEYINQGATVVISGPTGTGKSFLATALGESACRLGYRVKYYTLARLLDEVRLARLEGKELKFFEKKMIKAGAEEVFRFEIDPKRDLGFVDRTGRRYLDKGEYRIIVGKQKATIEVI